jgi:T4 RnlA family RNA ligase
MNQFQLDLYTNLMNLTKEGDTFYFQDFVLDGCAYRIFNYRLSSYTEFLRPSALECRGHMFEVDSNGVATRFAALPMSKFFNMNENPSTMDIDLSTVVAIMDKADGSLISTYMHGDQLRLKSKGSLFSEQAINAMAWLDRSENVYFKQLLTDFAAGGTTVNLEWVSPNNRIVLGYLEPNLLVLNARSTETGEYVNPWILHEHMAASVDLDGLDIVQFVNGIPDMLDDIEGYVVKLADGKWMKIKTSKYLSLHHAKDSVNNPRRLYECVLEEGVDDLRSMFFHDALAMKLIEEMQEKVTRLYNHVVKTVEDFYEANKALDRKSYAIKGRDEMPDLLFGLAMSKYLERPVDYKAFMVSRYKEFGFKDEAVIIQEDE